MGSKNLRASAGYERDKPKFQCMIKKMGRFSYYFLDHPFGGMSISSYKRSFGILPTYEDLANFELDDVVSYINKKHDFLGVDYKEVLQLDDYLNGEAIEYLNSKIGYDQYGAFYCESDQYDIRRYTSELVFYSDVNPENRRKFFTGERIDEISSRDIQNHQVDVRPPWAFDFKP